MLGEATIVSDLSGRIILSDRAAESLYGYQPLEMNLINLHDLTTSDLRGTVDNLLSITGDHEQVMIHRRKNGSTFTASVRSRLLSGAGQSFLLLTVLTASSQAEANLDQLTGCINRDQFLSDLRNLDSQPADTVITVVDVNGLRLINNSHGQSAGDMLLAMVSEHIRALLPDGTALARLSGDEFAFCLLQQSGEAADELARQIKNIPFIPGVGAGTSLSVGQARGLAGKDRPLEMLQAAEEQLLRDKLFAPNSLVSSLAAPLWQSVTEKNREDEGHARRMQRYAQAVGRHLGLTVQQLRDLALIALMHDVGKMAVPNSILDKPGRLNDEEWAIVKKHPEISYRIVRRVPFLGSVADCILAHHERWDGNGYPHGLAGDDIPLLARIISVVDSFDVMISGRPYKAAMSLRQSEHELRRCRGTQFDPRVVDAFINAVLKKPHNWLQRLNRSLRPAQVNLPSGL